MNDTFAQFLYNRLKDIIEIDDCNKIYNQSGLSQWPYETKTASEENIDKIDIDHVLLIIFPPRMGDYQYIFNQKLPQVFDQLTDIHMITEVGTRATKLLCLQEINMLSRNPDPDMSVPTYIDSAPIYIGSKNEI